MTTPLDQTRAEFEAWFAEWQRSTWRPHSGQPEMPAHWNTSGKHRMELAWQAAIASRAIPDGWQLVPEVITRDMWTAVNKLDDQMAAGNYDGRGCTIEQAWDCLLANSPTPPIAAKAAKETPQ